MKAVKVLSCLLHIIIFGKQEDNLRSHYIAGVQVRKRARILEDFVFPHTGNMTLTRGHLCNLEFKTFFSKTVRRRGKILAFIRILWSTFEFDLSMPLESNLTPPKELLACNISAPGEWAIYGPIVQVGSSVFTFMYNCTCFLLLDLYTVPMISW